MLSIYLLNVDLFLLIETKSRTSWWQQDKREQEEAAASGLDQPPLAKRKHKPHKVHECKNVARSCVVSA